MQGAAPSAAVEAAVGFPVGPAELPDEGGNTQKAFSITQQPLIAKAAF